VGTKDQRARSAGSILLCLIGLAISVWGFARFYAPISRSCVEPGQNTNCPLITPMRWTLAGIPIAWLGVAYFLVMGCLWLPVLARTSKELVSMIRLVTAVGGIVVVCVAFWTEPLKAEIHNATILVASGIVVVLFVLTVSAAVRTTVPKDGVAPDRSSSTTTPARI